MSKQTIQVLLCSIMLYLLGMHHLYSQNIEILDASQEPYTPESLIRNYFIGEGVEILDISYEGINEATGLFTNGFQDLGIEQGIILSTGKVTRFSNSFMNESSTLTSNDNFSNQELANIVGADLLDIASYEITFIPTADTIEFNYVFASEEYPEYVCSEYNDVFGFFLSGPNPVGGNYTSENIAIVPGTNLPVSINNVNNGLVGSSGNQADCAGNANLNYSQFYRDNNSEHLIFDGILTPFSAAAKVIPCEKYTIKFSIGDVVDFLKDSAVFLEGKSFSSNTVAVKALTTSANGTITEGCDQASIQFELPTLTNENVEINFKLLGTAQNGIDYETIPEDVVISAGQQSASISITPLADDLEEGIESIGVVIINGGCLSDTIWVGIEDNYLVEPEEQGPIYLCDDLAAEVDFTIPFTAPSPTVFRNQNEIRIEPTFEPVYSVIKVKDIYPSTLNQTDFIQVCIDELSHPWIDDLSIYLYGPDNQFIELTSKNGGNGGNGTQPDFYLNTCFTFDANDLISDPSFAPPYVGQFKPEGDWSDFFGRNSYKVNGDWRLMMIDDFQGSTGTLRSWSIHFGKSYDINYSWSPNTGISCTDCPNPSFNPSTSQTYTLNIDDTNGCNLNYELEVFADDNAPPSPEITCEITDTETILFSWEEVTSAISYNVSINGGPWEDIGQNISYVADAAIAGSEVTIEVEAIGACSTSDISSTSCIPNNCEVILELQSLVEPSCDLLDSGQITVLASGGMAPYTFTLEGDVNSSGIFENISSGNYIIYVLDAQNCASQLPVQIQGLNQITIEGIIDHIECGEETGSIDLLVTGGSGQLNLQWSENFTGDLNALTNDTYKLVVSDEIGCTAEKEFTINKVADFEVEIDIIHPKCEGDNSGAIAISLDDPSVSANFLWSNGLTESSIENLGPGIYDVVITDTNGCELTQSIELISTTSMQINADIQNNTCFGDNQGFVNIEIHGGDAPYDVNWSNNMAGTQLEGLSAGFYSAFISDSNGCEIIDSIQIADPQPLLIGDLTIVEPSCVLSTGSITLSPSGGSGPYMARLNNGEFEEQMLFSNLSPGEYQIEIMDDFGCTLKSEQIIHLEDKEELELVTESNVQLFIGESILLKAFVNNRDEGITYDWSGPDLDLLSCIDCSEPSFTGLNSTSYTVTATDEEGCHATQNVVINVNNNADVFVPNAFSPNGDGINDRLHVFAKSDIISSIDNFNIYDRWGNQVFNTSEMQINDYSQGWNGLYKGDILDVGIFVWNLQITFIDGTSKHYSGDVTLIK